MKCGLLGRKLGHSYSPQIHARLGDYSYELFEKEPEELEGFLKNGDFSSINVTVPYKKAVIPYLDELSPLAQKLGAVNTVVRRGGKLTGHNTDHFGFLTMVRSCGLSVSGKKVLVFIPEYELKEVHTNHTIGISQINASTASNKLCSIIFVLFFEPVIIDIPPPCCLQSYG